MRVKKYNDFILEKSIGSEEIRQKYYGDLEKRKYYQIINLDPTSVRKKDFSKPGKYSKWLLYQYKIGFLTDDNLNDKKFTDQLTNYLFLFSTNWYANQFKKSNFYIGGLTMNTMDNDINKFSLSNFMAKMLPLQDEFLSETQDAKYDIVYSDDLLEIFVPLNFTASRESAQNTQWCSSNYSGYSVWHKDAILFRILPKDQSLDKLKFTYKFDGKWFIAGPEYPEIMGLKNPFEQKDGVPEWLRKKNKAFDEGFEKDKVKYDGIEKTMRLLSPQAIECMMKYYNLNKK